MDRYEPPARPARPLFANDSVIALPDAPNGARAADFAGKPVMRGYCPTPFLAQLPAELPPANDRAGERLVMARLYSGQGSLPGIPATPQPRQPDNASHSPARRAGVRYYTEAVLQAGYVAGVSLHDRQRGGQRLRLFTFAEYGRSIAIARAANLCEALNQEHAAAMRNRGGQRT